MAKSKVVKISEAVEALIPKAAALSAKLAEGKKILDTWKDSLKKELIPQIGTEENSVSHTNGEAAAKVSRKDCSHYDDDKLAATLKELFKAGNLSKEDLKACFMTVVNTEGVLALVKTGKLTKGQIDAAWVEKFQYAIRLGLEEPKK